MALGKIKMIERSVAKSVVADGSVASVQTFFSAVFRYCTPLLRSLDLN